MSGWEGAAATPPPHPRLLRELSERAVLEALAREQGPLTRAELARRSGLSRPTIGDAVRRLEVDGVLVAVGVRSGYPGAAATFYDFAPTLGGALGVELNQHVTRVAVGGLLGGTLEETEHPPTAGTEDLRAVLRGLVGDPADGTARADGPVRAVTISVGAPVDPVDERAVPLPEGGHPRDPIRPAELLAGLDVPVHVENDVNLAAVAERRTGVATATTSFAYLYLGAGTSLGLGLMVDDRLVRGARGLAGEVGYLAVDAGRHALARAVGDADLASGTGADAAVVALGRAVTSICALVDPEMVVVGGPREVHDDVLVGIARHVEADAPRAVPLVRSALGASASVRGALLSARQRAWTDLLESRRGP
ncbi:ROK family transcriptional regulator [Actinomycetospora termitidis]|uniref:ROK family transcriptional regulator n=1 Tax=Actinomycetospora termitidis TaxID=3053470 RepID=A0ABT7MFP1_9PSEU|nr:ROK family transcriptional regulator [Actinomycetospora sp. Odt1-22]MDL5159483.1 ROK family transcriptional regulator [Actinomycetospora sp. Odt1-22]